MRPQALLSLLLLSLTLRAPAADPTPNSPILEPAVQPAPEDKPEVTQQMKDDFLSLYRQAIVTNDPTKYLALVCLDGLDDNSRAVVLQGAEHSLSFLAGRIEGLTFDWTTPDPEDTKVFERNGFRYHPNLSPIISLLVTIKRDPSESKDLPSALQPTLGIKNGQLLILGMVHEKLPEPPAPKPPEKSVDD